MDILALVEGGEGGLLEPGVEFDLVRGGDDARFAEEALELRFAEIGNADGFGLAALERLLHGFPGVDVVGIARFYLFVFLRYEDVAPREGGWPVHEVEVQVVGAEVFERGVEGWLHVVGVV